MKTTFVLVLTFAIFTITPQFAQANDNFNDNTISGEWTYLQDFPTLSLNETNQRLEVTAAAPTNPNFDALYVSNGPTGFLLDTAADFDISIKYVFTSAIINGNIGNALALVFGVGRDLPDGTDSAAIGFGYANLGLALPQLVGNSRTDDVSAPLIPLVGGTTSGTFRITYNSADDDLTFGVDGNLLGTFTLNNTVQGIWNADSLYVSFGARGNGFNVSGGNAYLDDFSINSGTQLPVPEPTSVVLVTGAFVVLCRRLWRDKVRT